MTEGYEQDTNALQQIQSLFESFFAGDDLFEPTIQDFFDAWTSGEYGNAYDLLSDDSPLRQGLARAEWVTLREQWRAEAQPAGFIPSAIEERIEEDEEELEDEDEELEDEEDEDEDEDEEDEDYEEEGIVDICWSIEMNETPLSARLPELPKATVTYGETRRHWFWSSYQLITVGNAARIVSMTDEGTKLAELPHEELERRIEELQENFNRLASKIEEEEESNKGLFADEAEDIEDDIITESLSDTLQGFMLTSKGLHYHDALMANTSQITAEQIATAARLAETAQDLERAASYLQTLIERYPSQNAEALTNLANVQQRMAQTQEESGGPRATRFFQLAEQNLRASLKQGKTAMALILLAQQLSHEYAKFDEAETLLKEAETLSPDANEALMIAVNYGMIAEYRNNTEEAIQHYLRATNIAPDFPNIWNNIGYLQMNLESYDEAEKSLLLSIDHDPQNTEAYIHLADLYTQVRSDLEGAEDVLLQGLEVADEDVGLIGKLAEVYINKGDLNEAERFLDVAEELAPDSTFVQELRAAHTQARTEKRRAMKARAEQRQTSKSNKSKKHKK